MKSQRLKLKQTLERDKNRIGLVGVSLEINEVPGNSFSGYITSDWRTIALNYGRELELIPDEQTARFTRSREITDSELKVGSDILTHECGHRENPVGTRLGCPHAVEMHDAIKETIHQALKSKGRQGLDSYVTNAFEDVLDNMNCRRHTDYAGQTLFWNNQGLVSPDKDGKFSPFYEAFVKINLILGRGIQDTILLRRQDTVLLRRFYSNKPEVQTAVRGFIGDMRAQLRTRRVIGLHQTPKFNTLFSWDLEAREQLWTALAYSFASHTAELLDEMPKQRMFGSKSGPSQGSPSTTENSDEENPFDKEMKMPENRQKVAYRRYKAGKGPALHRDAQEQLYDLYRRISREIRIETSNYSDASNMPLVHFGRRFSTEDDTKIRFRGIGVKEDGSLGIKTSRHHLDFPISFKTHPVRFPKFKLALMDRSGSMSSNPENEEDVGNTAFIPWGDRSKYHFALKGYFGIDNYFDMQGIAPYVECAALGFSQESLVRGNSKEVARSLLVRPSGGTSLDVNGLEKCLEENSLVVSISDGKLSVPDGNEKERFERKISACDYAHFQIGGQTSFSAYLEGLHVPVFYVKGDDDLSRIMVSFVHDKYKPKSQGAK